ncbi:MAG TPA: M56 family metallopeptidase, partial [Candidatus Acidoferrum sp.]|nr:M56 family metallopeptidase [Candidatus Acidoferrum sp.]
MMALPSLSLFGAFQQVGNHLWQSTLCLAMVVLLTLACRDNRAHVRHWLWLAASVKFLVPFAPLMAIGGQFGQHSHATVQPMMSFLVGTVSQPFSRSAFQPAAVASSGAGIHSLWTGPALLVGLWFLGCAVVLLRWYAGWRRVSAAVRQGLPIEDGREVDTLRRLERMHGLNGSIAVIVSNMSFEPGVFGIAKPVLLWPHDIGDRLDDGHLEAILAHEVCHVQRRDNLAVAVHMFVEALFWFHPLIWWVERRLVDERERACDEEVIRWGSQPHVYAESILKTCEFYIGSPFACLSGVTGSDLKKRIEAIMTNGTTHALTTAKRVLLASAGIAALAGPLVVGLLSALHIHAQSPASVTQSRAAVRPGALTIALASTTRNTSAQPVLAQQTALAAAPVAVQQSPLAAGTTPTAVCGFPIPTPVALPPAGSGPVVLYVAPCFEAQGNRTLVPPETYLSYIQLKPSRPPAGVWAPYDDAAEKTVAEDLHRLWDSNLL